MRKKGRAMPAEGIFGYQDRVLHVDLTQMRVRSLELPRQIREEYIGGTGCGAYFLYQNVRREVEWNDPRNILAIFSGPLGGTRYPGSGTVSVVT